MVRGPRNNYHFSPQGRVTLMAAGIGITPLLSMALEAERQACDWRLIYLVCEREEVCLPETLRKLPESRVWIHYSAESGRIDLAQWTQSLNGHDAVYACGPMRLLDDLTALNEMQASWKLHLERFENPNRSVGQALPFEVVLARSGKTFAVDAEKSILEVLRGAGMDLPWSCCDGVCGTCEQVVLSGTPEHRDAVLSPEERLENTHMMICVSRSLSPRITLDL